MPRSGRMLLVYALTLFISAYLLFLVQPLEGKLIVPLLGGFPSVWNTCMVFFQAMLLAGYAYAHWSTTYLGVRRQAAVHLGVLLLPFLVLTPLGVFTSLVPAGEDNPIPGLLLMLLASVGLPFFAVAATAPLLQRWFASTDHPAARDPYFLYAASNVGSMLALLGYPTLVEPNLMLLTQRWAWTIGYALLVLLIAFCAVLLWRSNPAPAEPAREEKGAKKSAPRPAVSSQAITGAERFRVFVRDFAGPSLEAPSLRPTDDEPTWGRVLRWVALGAVPSSLMLGVTTYITTDIAAIPLLWVLPLALYLLSFILVFSRLPAWVHKAMVLALPVLLLLLIFVMISKSRLPVPMWLTMLLHMGVLFVVAMVCHGELARTRPPARSLTKFYLWMSVGGVVGGLFNALVAPVVFTGLAEYPIAMALAGFFLPRIDDQGRGTWRALILDFALPIGLATLALEFFNGFQATGAALRRVGLDNVGPTLLGWIDSAADALSVDNLKLRHILTYSPPIVLCYLFVERPLRYGLGLSVLLLASLLPSVFDNQLVYRDRSFFGTLTVRAYEDARYVLREDAGVESYVGVLEHRLQHGNILHGTQFMDEDYASEPLTYYHRSGPVGDLMAELGRRGGPTHVAVVGLGTGSMAAYATPQRRVTFYEIDRKVKEISFDQDRYFSYVQDAKKRGADVEIVLGDARLSLDRERTTKPDEKFDVIIVDAFSSDAIPVHLITKEALGIYLDKLKPDGIVAFHTSNRYLALEPVVANIASAHESHALAQHDNCRYKRGEGPTTNGLVDPSSNNVTEEPAGASSSSWVLVARQKEHFGKLPELTKEVADSAGVVETKTPWHYQEPNPKVGVWSDDYSNLLKVFEWSSK